jgi:hypothetical protein
LHSVREIEKFRRRSLFPETPSLKKRAIVPKTLMECGKSCAVQAQGRVFPHSVTRAFDSSGIH